tara:strand:+ start:255 stop:1484 length:1230 start_codon:yes stop_codon:yes gene_type:complete
MSDLKSIIISANKNKLKNDYYSAIDLYEQAIRLNPKNIDLMYEVASMYRSLGDLAKAKHHFFQIIKKEPKNTKSHRMLSTLIDYKVEDEHLNVMLKLFNSKNLNQVELIDLEFALGKAYEDKEDYENSFKHYKNANDKKHENVGSNIDSLNQHFFQILDVYQKINFNLEPAKIVEDKKIIFICGMQRSGTTLVEQIISKHDEVYGANELNILLNVIRNNFLTDFKLDKIKILENIKNKKNLIQEAYLEMALSSKISEKYITDKANENFKWIGIIKLFLPNSIILHCERDQSDICFSIFKNNFNSKNMNWSSKPEHIRKYYNFYKKIMNFWKKECGDFLYNISYEKLVNNSENEIKKLIKICNLKWDDKCLKFYENNKTYVRTTSAVQARMPIYSKSIGNYLNYKDFIKF